MEFLAVNRRCLSSRLARSSRSEWEAAVFAGYLNIAETGSRKGSEMSLLGCSRLVQGYSVMNFKLNKLNDQQCSRFSTFSMLIPRGRLSAGRPIRGQGTPSRRGSPQVQQYHNMRQMKKWLSGGLFFTSVRSLITMPLVRFSPTCYLNGYSANTIWIYFAKSWSSLEYSK